MKSTKISLLEKMNLKHCFRKEKRNNLFSVKDIYEETEKSDIRKALNNERDIDYSEQEKHTLETKNFVDIDKSKKKNGNFVTEFDDEPYETVDEDNLKMPLSDFCELVAENSEKLPFSESNESVDEDSEELPISESNEFVDADSEKIPISESIETVDEDSGKLPISESNEFVDADSEELPISESIESVDEDSEKMPISESDESTDEGNEKMTFDEPYESVDEDSKEVSFNKLYESNNGNAEKAQKYNSCDLSLENEKEKRTFYREKNFREKKLTEDLDNNLDNKRKKYIGTIIVSPFLNQELDKFSFQRNKLLNNKLFFVDYHVENLLQRYRFACFNNAIEIIEDKVRKKDQQILILKQEYEDKIQQIKMTYELYSKHQTPHHAQNCIEQAQNLCNEYREMIKDHFLQIIELLSEEIKLIKKMNNEIDSYKEKRLFVIRYYYNAVVKEKGRLFLSNATDDEVYIYSDKILDVFYGGRLNRDHTMKCNEVENKLECFKKQTNILLSVKFW